MEAASPQPSHGASAQPLPGSTQACVWPQTSKHLGLPSCLHGRCPPRAACCRAGAGFPKVGSTSFQEVGVQAEPFQTEVGVPPPLGVPAEAWGAAAATPLHPRVGFWTRGGFQGSPREAVSRPTPPPSQGEDPPRTPASPSCLHPEASRGLSHRFSPRVPPRAPARPGRPRGRNGGRVPSPTPPPPARALIREKLAPAPASGRFRGPGSRFRLPHIPAAAGPGGHLRTLRSRVRAGTRDTPSRPPSLPRWEAWGSRFLPIRVTLGFLSRGRGGERSRAPLLLVVWLSG